MVNKYEVAIGDGHCSFKEDKPFNVAVHTLRNFSAAMLNL